MSLTTRPDHVSRLRALVTGAAEGKGLSQLVIWDDESESFDNSIHKTEEYEHRIEADVSDEVQLREKDEEQNDQENELSQ